MCTIAVRVRYHPYFTNKIKGCKEQISCSKIQNSLSISLLYLSPGLFLMHILFWVFIFSFFLFWIVAMIIEKKTDTTFHCPYLQIGWNYGVEKCVNGAWLKERKTTHLAATGGILITILMTKQCIYVTSYIWISF